MAERVNNSPAEFLTGGGEMGALMRAHDWSGSPLGDPADWPDALKNSVSICLNSRFPMVLWWGPERIMLYNDAWRPVLGATKHPGGLGRPGIETWREIWHIIGPQMDAVERGEATWAEDLLLPMDRYGYLEETYFTYSYSPIKDIKGHISGIFTAVSETTGRVLGERRLRALTRLGEQVAEAKDVHAACEAFAATVEHETPDLPFALTYLLSDDGGTARLACTAGIGREDPRVPSRIAIDPSDDNPGSDPWGVARAVAAGSPMTLDNLSQQFPDLPGGVWPEPTRAAMALPFAKAGQNAATAGVLVAGVNARRALDDEYPGLPWARGRAPRNRRQQRARLCGGTPQGRGAGGDRPRQDHLFL